MNEVKFSRVTLQFDHSSVASGRKRLYGVPLGIMALDSEFPRIPGDAGNASTWPFPVHVIVVPGATQGRVLDDLDAPDLTAAFVQAAKHLQGSGVSAITTTCGFLFKVQDRLQAAVDVPVITSSLLQIPWVAAILPAAQAIGVVTIDRGSLPIEHLSFAAGTGGRDVLVGGLDEVGGHYFADHLRGNREDLDSTLAQAEHVRLALKMVTERPDIGAFVLECANMPPYAAGISRATGRPVFDLTTAVSWMVGAARRRTFEGYL